MDVKQELIKLDRTEKEVSADSLPQVVPDTSPRYHFYRFKHTHEGDYQEAIGEPEVVNVIINCYHTLEHHYSIGKVQQHEKINHQILDSVHEGLIVT